MCKKSADPLRRAGMTDFQFLVTNLYCLTCSRHKDRCRLQNPPCSSKPVGRSRIFVGGQPAGSEHREGGGGMYPLKKMTLVTPQNWLQQNHTFSSPKSSKMLLIFDLKNDPASDSSCTIKSASLFASKVCEDYACRDLQD